MSKNGRGYLMRNERPKPDGTGPVQIGQIRIAGREYSLAAWKLKNCRGKPFLSLNARPIEDAAQESEQ